MPNLGKLALIFLAAVVVLALTPTAGWGQNVYGSITGTVTDTSGAAISEATVTLTNLDKGEKRTIESDSSGNYTLVNILPGRYKLEGERSGFKKFVREPIVVQIESGLRVDISLQVGAQSETVEVTSETPLLQSETQSLGEVIEQRSVTELPLNGRNPLRWSVWFRALYNRERLRLAIPRPAIPSALIPSHWEIFRLVEVWPGRAKS